MCADCLCCALALYTSLSLCVCCVLCIDAKYDRAHLLTFLRNSNAYILEEAYELCNRQQFHPECVFLLERMGEYRAALSVLIHPLCDVRGAIAFVEEHKDDQLWQELITRSLSSPEFLSDLLEHVCAAASAVCCAVLCSAVQCSAVCCVLCSERSRSRSEAEAKQKRSKGICCVVLCVVL